MPLYGSLGHILPPAAKSLGRQWNVGVMQRDLEVQGRSFDKPCAHPASGYRFVV